MADVTHFLIFVLAFFQHIAIEQSQVAAVAALEQLNKDVIGVFLAHLLHLSIFLALSFVEGTCRLLDCD